MTRAVVLLLLLATLTGAGIALGGSTSPRASRVALKYVQGAALPADVGEELGDGLAADAAGNVYMTYRRRVGGSSFWDVAVLGRDARVVRRFGLTLGGRTSPHLAVGGPGGLVYLASTDGGTSVEVYRPDGTRVRELGSGQLSDPADLDVDAAGNVYALSLGFPGHADETVVRLSPAGQVTGRFAPLPAQQYGSPSGGLLHGVAVAGDGSIWVTTTGAKRPLVHLDADGRELAGSPRLDVLVPGGGFGAFIADVDVANGLLYVAGRGQVDQLVVALSPDGHVIDLLCCGQARAVAVSGDALYVAGLGATAASRAVASTRAQWRGVMTYRGKQAMIPAEGDVAGSVSGSSCEGEAQNDLIVPFVTVRHRGAGCKVTFSDFSNPCPPHTAPLLRNSHVWVGGEKKPEAMLWLSGQKSPAAFAGVTLDDDALADGPVVIEWACANDADRLPPVTQYEWKGQVWLRDPSGTVLDAKTGRPVEGASVRLQYSPTGRAPFAAPGASGFSPQVNPQVTSANGHFGWDVADGYWRLRVTAFGYRALSSAVYRVPPEVTGLELRLQRDAAQQLRLIDPRGRVGAVALGSSLAKTRRVAGLRISVAHKRVRSIAVLSPRFRTVRGIAIGSVVGDLRRAYPASTRSVAKVSGGLQLFRVARATFGVRAGRVVVIRLGGS